MIRFTMSELTTNEVRFRERAELLDFLLEASAAISETLDLDKLLAKVAEIIRKVIPVELFSILLYSEKNQGLVIRYAIGHREEVVKNLVIPLGEGITGAAAAAREPVLVPDVSQDTRYLKAVALRLDKLRANPARDAQNMALFQPLWSQWERRASHLAKAGVRDETVEQFRWLLEELRVQLFAQELRTPVPVSVKRLQTMWESAGAR